MTHALYSSPLKLFDHFVQVSVFNSQGLLSVLSPVIIGFDCGILKVNIHAV